MRPAETLEPDPAGRRVARRYLLRGEQVVVVTRRHWVTLAGPVCALAGAVLLTLWFAAAGTQRETTMVALVALLMVSLWAAWRWLEWRREWFIATDRRLLRTYGLLTQRVAMMPLAKVTDMSYDRSIPGRLLNYGQFVMESAGQDQALSRIDHVPNPDEKYQAMCETIFGRDVSDPGEDGDSWEGDHRDQTGPLPRISRGGPSAHRRADAALPRRWEAVDHRDLPDDWDWVGEEARGARAATRSRSHGRSQVAVDPDPTPWR